MVKKVGFGHLTMFWKDHWFGDIPLTARFPMLFLSPIRRIVRLVSRSGRLGFDI